MRGDMKLYQFSQRAEVRSLVDAEQKRCKEYPNYWALQGLTSITQRHFLFMDLVFRLPESMTAEQTAKVDAIIRRAWDDVFYGVLRATDERTDKKT